MKQNHLFSKRQGQVFLMIFTLFSILCFGVFLKMTADANNSNVSQAAVYHQHTDKCYSMAACGGTGRLDEYLVYNCSCNMEHPCIEHECYWEKPNSMYPTGCWHCYCPKDEHWVCTRCYRIIPGSFCEYEERKLTCGKEGSVTAQIFVEKADTEWCKQLDLRADVEVSGAVLSETPYVWDGTPSDQNVYTVTENGIHTFRLQADENSNTAAAIVSVLVSNIDTTGPQIISCVQEPAAGWTREPAKLIITDIQDLQPDGSSGSGLADLPLAFEDGDWSADRVFICEDSGTYTILMQDVLGNVTREEVEVKHVDVTGPKVTLDWDQTPDLTEVTVHVSASDEQKDGSAGCGLAAWPYSYDNGMTWTDETVFKVEENESYTVLVKDKIGNITETAAEIANLDKTGPQVAICVTPEKWYGEGIVTITAEASDEGSGLEVAPCSWDGGNTWTDEFVKEVEQAGVYQILVRDKNGNITECEVQITRLQPDRPDSGKNDNVADRDNGSFGAADESNSIPENGDEKQENKAENAAEDTDNDSVIGENTQTGSISGNDPAVEREVTEEDSQRKQSEQNAEEWYGSDSRTLASQTEWEPEGTSRKNDEVTGSGNDMISGNEASMNKVDEGETAGDLDEVETKQNTVRNDTVYTSGKYGLYRQILENKAAKAVTVAASSALLISVVGLFFFLLLMGVRVYDVTDDGRGRLLGMRICHRSEERFRLVIPESMYEKSETGRFRLRPGMVFISMNRDQEMLVEYKEEQRQISVKISENMEFMI